MERSLEISLNRGCCSEGRLLQRFFGGRSLAVLAGTMLLLDSLTAVAAVVYTVEKGADATAIGTSRTNWGAAKASGNDIRVDDLNALSGFTNQGPVAVTSGSFATPWLPVGGTAYTFDAGNTSVGWLGGQTDAYLSLLNYGNLFNSMALRTTYGSGSSAGRWSWLQFTPDLAAGEKAVGFAVDGFSTFFHDSSDRPYVGWTIYFTDNTRTNGRLLRTGDLSQDAAMTWFNSYITVPSDALTNYFFGVRESDPAKDIAKVEFMHYSNGTNTGFDNISWEVAPAAVPEPAVFGPVACLAVTGVVAMIRRRQIRQYR